MKWEWMAYPASWHTGLCTNAPVAAHAFLWQSGQVTAGLVTCRNGMKRLWMGAALGRFFRRALARLELPAIGVGEQAFLNGWRVVA